MSSHPTAFVSYSWDNETHKQWVADIATRLRQDGVDARLDQWHTVPGDQLPRFMEAEIRENQFVIVICTPNYKRKSDARTGGVGYEGDIMTAEVVTTGNHRKFIPVLASGEWMHAAPSWLAGKYYLDFSDADKLGKNYADLFSTIVGRRPPPPPLGAPPANHRPPPNSLTPLTAPEGIRIIGVIVDEVTEPRMDGTRGSALYRVPFRLSRKPSPEWTKLFLASWQMPPSFTTMHRPGIAGIVADRIVLDGTTIEEVQKYHKKTLRLCVDQANAEEAKWKLRLAQQQAVATEQSQARKKTIAEIASQMRFDDEAAP